MSKKDPEPVESGTNDDFPHVDNTLPGDLPDEPEEPGQDEDDYEKLYMVHQEPQGFSPTTMLVDLNGEEDTEIPQTDDPDVPPADYPPPEKKITEQRIGVGYTDGLHNEDEPLEG